MDDRGPARRRGWICLVLLLLAATALLLAPAEAWGRAGGGGGYHSSGGGGGGGGGTGGAIYLIIRLIILIFEYPYIGVPIVVVLGVVIYISSREGKKTYQASVIRKGSGAVTEVRRDKIVARLHKNDPAFDEAAFTRRVSVAFEKIQAAWCGQDLTPVRPFISDGVHERFSLQFDEQRQLGYREKMDGLKIRQAGVVDLATDGLFDEVAVKITAEAADYRVSLGDGSRVSGSKSVEPFTEYWSFLRRRGTQTAVSKTGLIEGNCPNCGAAIELNQSAVCKHCKALLRSGEYDWVLAEITQESEWNGLSRGHMPGVSPLKKRDPDFDPCILEDRASVVFWRKVATDRTAKIAPLRKMASPEFCLEYQKSLRAPAGVKRSYYGDCAVGAVTTRGVILGDEIAGEPDRALVEIRWAGTRQLSTDGGPPKSTGEYGLFRTLFVLARSAATKTDLGMGIASAHCPSCGAPELAADADSCEFCGAVLNDGTRGWVLAAVVAMNSAGGNELLKELEAQSPPPTDAATAAAVLDPTSLLAWMVRVASADGTIDPSERKMLDAFAARRDIPAKRVEQMAAAARAGTLESPMPATALEGQAWIAELVAVGMADGTLSDVETRVLRALAGKMGLSKHDVNKAVLQGRSRQYAATRDAMRAAKRAKK